MNNWFTADQHFNHENIITKFVFREFRNSTDMNAELIKRHNSRVKAGDTVYHLGDFKMTNNGPNTHELLGKLNGRHVFIKGNHDCMSLDTRILTVKGYKFYNEIAIGDLIPTLNTELGKVEIKPIRDIIINPVNLAYSFKSKTAEGVFSNNHDLLVTACVSKKNIHKEKCSELWKRKAFFNVIASHGSGNTEYQITDDEIKFIGWIFTDGGIDRRGEKFVSCGIWQSKEDNIIYIRNLLRRLGLTFTEKATSKQTKEICGRKLKSCKDSIYFYINAESSRNILGRVKIISKYDVQEWMYQLSDRQMVVLIDEMVKGDGSIANSGTKVIWGNKVFLDKILGLCVTHGIDANMVQDVRGNYYLSIHVKTKEKRIFDVRQIHQDHRHITPYSKNMWCVNVDNHNIFIELNGKPLICGNSNNGTSTCLHYGIIELYGQRVILAHRPEEAEILMAVMSIKLGFCGHVHEKWQFRETEHGLLVNVGVDVWDFYPIDAKQIFKAIKGRGNGSYLSEARA